MKSTSISQLHRKCATLLFPVLLAACSDELSLYPDGNTGVRPRITISASIDQKCLTRADESGFADGDRFGVYVVNYAGETPGTLSLTENQVNNVSFSYDADKNVWTSATDVYWRDNETPADIYGYYPFDNGLGDVESYRFEVESNQSEAGEGGMSNYEASDFLWAKAARALPGRKVDLIFRHVMAGVRVTLEKGGGFEGDEWEKLPKAVTVDNTVRTSEVNLSTGDVVPSGAADRNILMSPESGCWRAVVVPQKVESGKSVLGIVIDGITYRYNRADDMTYTSGKLHNFSIRIDRKAEGAGYTLTLVSEDIAEWEADAVSHDFESNSYLVVDVPVAGTLKECLETANVDLGSVKNLKLTGEINEEDYRVMREEMFSLTAVNLKEVKSYADRWNESTGNIEKVEKVFPDNAFNGNKSIRKIILPQDITSIGSNGFSHMTLSSTIVIPETVTVIRQWAFAETSGVFTVLLPNKLERIEESAFFRSSVSIDLNLPVSLKHIGFRAFSDTPNIYGTFSLPSNLEYLGAEAFDGCGHNLCGQIAIPEKIKEIPKSAFNSLGFNKSVELRFHDGVTKIGPGAFSGLKFSAPISFPKNLTSIGSGAFVDCSFSGDLILPEGVSDLGKNAFSSTNIKGTLKLPDSLEIFGGTDFDYWVNDNGSFSSTLIERLIIGDNVEIITEDASVDCRMLRYVSIGKNVTVIGNNAFAGCPLIETVVCLANEPPALDDTSFSSVDYTHCVVEVPEASVAAYRNAPGWNRFRSITAHHELNFSLSEFSCLNKGITRKLTVRADGPWEVTDCPSWIHISPDKADCKEDITVTVDPASTGTGDREADVLFKLKNSNYTSYMTIRQFDFPMEEDSEIVLQKASGKGSAINVFVVGEGYGAEDIVNGNYMSRVNETVEGLFSIEPYKTYRNMFNISTSLALSPDNGAMDVLTSKATKFGFFFPQIDCPVVSELTCHLKEYVKKVSSSIDNSNIDKCLIVMLANYDSFAGSAYQCVDDNCNIAFIGNSHEVYPFDNRGLVLRYAGGMAFAGLASEEITHMETIKGCTYPGCAPLGTYKEMKSKGLFENVTISGKIGDSPWHDFMFHPKYGGVVDMYEGGLGHSRGVWRSEIESVMNTYVPYYNTISRYAIYKHMMRRAGLTPSIDEFIANDKIEIPE